MIDDSMFQERVQRLKQVQEAEPENIIEDTEQPEKVTFLRVFTYPINVPGLSIIALYAGIPFLLVLVLYPMPPMIRMGLFFPALLIKIMVVLSTLWYLSFCVRAVAEGQVHPPNLFEFGSDDSLGSWFRQFLLLAAAFIACIFPAFIFIFSVGTSAWTQVTLPVTVMAHAGLIFWLLLSTGIFLLPMCILSIVMFDSLEALNPPLIISSVFSTFFSYLLVPVLFFVPIVLFIITAMMKDGAMNLVLLLLLRVIGCYLLVMDAYVLGWFFYKNEEKLRWDV